MISANEIILIYNEIFKELEERFSFEKVLDLWGYFRNEYCMVLEEYVKNEGLKGMFEYWSQVFEEEGGLYNLTLSDNEFILDVHYCPSVGKLINTKVDLYDKYCQHCPTLYNPIIKKYGYEIEWYLINPKKGECRAHVWIK